MPGLFIPKSSKPFFREEWLSRRPMTLNHTHARAHTHTHTSTQGGPLWTHTKVEWSTASGGKSKLKKKNNNET